MRKLDFAILLAAICCQGQDARPTDPVAGINAAFDTHDVVLFGGTDGSIPEDQILLDLVRSGPFVQRGGDMTIPCNSLYQQVVDRYLAGENVSQDQLQLAWRNSLAIGPVPDKPFEELFSAAREVNQHRSGQQRKVGIVCTDGPADWQKVQTRADLEPFVPKRDEILMNIVKEQILAKHQKGLIYMGALHFRRTGGTPSQVERSLKDNARTYLVVAGSNITGSYRDQDSRFLKWKWPWMLRVEGSWLGQLPAKPLFMGGNGSNARIEGTLSEATDAFIFLGPPDELKAHTPRRSDLEGTAYGKETERRLRIIFGEGRKLPDFMPKDDSGVAPKYAPPSTAGR